MSYLYFHPAKSFELYGQKMTEDVPQIRKADLENHNKDGGLWVVINGRVYDVQDFKSQAPCGSEILLEYAARDATEAFDSIPHSPEAREMMHAFFVGNYIDVSYTCIYMYQNKP